MKYSTVLLFVFMQTSVYGQDVESLFFCPRIVAYPGVLSFSPSLDVWGGSEDLNIVLRCGYSHSTLRFRNSELFTSHVFVHLGGRIALNETKAIFLYFPLDWETNSFQRQDVESFSVAFQYNSASKKYDWFKVDLWFNYHKSANTIYPSLQFTYMFELIDNLNPRS